MPGRHTHSRSGRRRSSELDRPLFCVATVPVSDTDAPAARQLGRELYDVLTRPRGQPLAPGPGIPVAIGVDDAWRDRSRVDSLADQVLLVLVAGATSLLLDPVATWDRLNGPIPKHDGGLDPTPGREQKRLSKLLLATDPRWLAESSRGDAVAIAQTVLNLEDPRAGIDEVLLAIGGCLRATRKRPTLLISAASNWQTPLVIDPTVIARGRERWQLLKYFEAVKSAGDQRRASRGTEPEPEQVLVSVQGPDREHDRVTQRDLMWARQRGMAIVVVEADRLGAVEQSSQELLGAALPDLLRAAAVEHLRHLHFRLVGKRIIQSARLPLNTQVTPRPPDLLDLFGGILQDHTSPMVLHPDPPLPPEERELLRAAAPLMHAVTPSTLLVRHDRSDSSQRSTSPLDGMRVGLSVSDIGDGDFEPGQSSDHLQDATVQLARTLLSGGAVLTYGGDFRLGHETSFTPLLAELVETYSQTAERPPQRLRIFQSVAETLDSIPQNVRCVVRHLGLSPELARRAVFKAGEVERVPRGMLTADMRRAMTDETDVRIAIGGKSHPRRDVEDDAGYSGRFPVVAEEVYRAINADQPVYLCGGFGGITRRLTRLLDTPHDRDRFWQDESYRENPLFVRVSWDVDQDPRRALLGLPTSFRALADAICELAIQLGEDDDAWRNWNGLTLRQNRTLWQATEPVLISSLIASGIASWRGRRNARDRNLRVEAIRGEITSVGNVDLLTLPVFDDIEPGGAGAAIDKLTGGLVRQGQSSPGSLVGVRGLELDVDYLCAVSLGRAADVMGDEAELKRRIEQAAHDVSELCLKEGFNSMAVVTYGGAVLKEHAEAVSAMLRGFNSAGGNLLIKWVERSEEKFNSLCETLRGHGGVDLTTVVQPIATPPSVSPRWFQLAVSWHDNRLEVTLLPPDGNSGIPSQSVDLSHAQLEELARGAGIGGTATPSMEELRVRGNELAELLLGDFAELMWQREPGLSLAIIHDAESSKIPFEMIRFSDADVLQTAPAVRGGVHRWLAVKSGGASLLSSAARISHQLRVGLVIDPTGDLMGARAEGERVRAELLALADEVQVQSLLDQEAQIPSVREMLRQVDVFHYCGHAHFDSQLPGRGGLQLAAGKVLTAGELQELNPIPRVVICNACQAARTRRGDPKALAYKALAYDSYSVAEWMLRAGVEAFVGTSWEVSDAAAADFARVLYKQLAAGETLRHAVTQGRRALAEAGKPDWANYVLYGDGRFRLT